MEHDGKPYREFELDLILSHVPTEQNLAWLEKILKRSGSNILQVYRTVYTDLGRKPGMSAAYQKNVSEAKKRANILIGPPPEIILNPQHNES